MIWSCLSETMGAVYAGDPDAPASALAQKLGYHFSHRYTVYYDAGEG